MKKVLKMIGKILGIILLVILVIGIIVYAFSVGKICRFLISATAEIS